MSCWKFKIMYPFMTVIIKETYNSAVRRLYIGRLFRRSLIIHGSVAMAPTHTQTATFWKKLFSLYVVFLCHQHFFYIYDNSNNEINTNQCCIFLKREVRLCGSFWSWAVRNGPAWLFKCWRSQTPDLTSHAGTWASILMSGVPLPNAILCCRHLC